MLDKIRTPRRKSRSFWLGQVSLQWMLTVPFIIQVMAVVGLVGYLSYRNAESTVADLTNQLMATSSVRAEQNINNYLATPWTANRLISDAVRRGDFQVELDRSNPRLEKYLWDRMQMFDNLTWISLGEEATNASMGVWRPSQGESLQFSFSGPSTQYFGNYYATDAQGNRTRKLKIEKPAFYPRTRPWYKEAATAGKGVWTSIYAGFTPGTVFIAASEPLYNPAGKLVGVSGIDLSMAGIQKYLADNPVSKNGQTFIIDRAGLLVASSSQESPFRLVRGREMARVNSSDSQTPAIRSSVSAIKQQVGELKNLPSTLAFEFNFNGDRQFVRVASFAESHGLDWLVITIVPRSDVMGEIQAGTQTTIGLCLMAVFAAIGLNTALSRRLARPIGSLSQASQQIAQGNFDRPLVRSGIRELATLSEFFKLMSREIQESRRQLEDYSKSLEQKVEERTQDLQREIDRRIAAQTSLHQANEELQRIAYLDGLTQIANRRQFDERLLQEWQRTQRQGASLSIVLCDVDFFKQYNDTYGHQIGDKCLQAVAQAIAASARRAGDLAARYGGEEFVAILPDTDLNGALAVARSIQSRVMSLKIPHATSPIGDRVTLSMGVATLVPSKSTTPAQLLEAVDRVLYRAKVSGRDRIVEIAL